MTKRIPLRLVGYVTQTIQRRHRELAAILPAGASIEEKTSLGFVMVLTEIFVNVRIALAHFGLGDTFGDVIDLAKHKCDTEWPGIVEANTKKGN